MIHTDQAVQRGSDLMAHIGKELFLGFFLFRSTDRLYLIPHHDQEHTEYRQNTDDQHDHAHGKKRPGLLPEYGFVDRHDKIQAYFFIKGDKIKQLFVFFTGMGVIKGKGLKSREFFGNLFICQLRILGFGQMCKQIILFVLVYFFIDIYDVMSLHIDEGAVTAAYAVFGETVDYHFILDG